MTLQATGAISLNNIKTEFLGPGGPAGLAANPVSISEYYNADVGVPTSGAISFSDFYSKNKHASKSEALTAFTTTAPSNYNGTFGGGNTNLFLLHAWLGVNEQYIQGTVNCRINRWISSGAGDTGVASTALIESTDANAALRNTTKNTILSMFVGTSNPIGGIFSSLSFNGSTTSWSESYTASDIAGSQSKINLYYGSGVKWKDYTTAATGLSIGSSMGGIGETAWYTAHFILPSKWTKYSQLITAFAQSPVEVSVPAGGILIVHHAHGANNNQTPNMATCATKKTDGTPGPTISSTFGQRGVTWYRGIGTSIFKNTQNETLLFVIPRASTTAVSNAVHAVVLTCAGDGYLNAT
jgi:hypothetical protein